MDTLRKNNSIVADMVRRVLTAWLLTVTVQYFLLPSPLKNLDGLAALQHLSLFWTLTGTVLGCCLLWALSFFCQNHTWERWLMVTSAVVLSAAALIADFSWRLLGACVLIVGIFTGYAYRGWNRASQPRPDRKKSNGAVWVTVGLTVGFFLFVSLWTVCRVRSFSTPTYDMGIFSQMFYHMKESGLPMTSVERDGLLSHFAVHVSPVYYLMLPFYYLLPRPETLQVLQAAVMASAVIPLWRIGKYHGLSPWLRCGICTVMLFYPAFAGGSGYDIHENCFLTPLILLLLDSMDRKQLGRVVLFGFLTLTIKEDAAIYVAVAGLYQITRTLLRFRKRDTSQLIAGVVLLLGAIGWFLGVTTYLDRAGDGLMTYRYQNLIYDRSGSLTRVIAAVLLHPMKAVYECIDPEKLPFIAMTLLPLLGLPLWTRRYERLLLLIPYVLVNLLSDYTYQHNIFFQYTFGSLACLLYLTAVNLAEAKLSRLLTVWLAAVVCAACFFGSVVPKATVYIKMCIQYSTHYSQIRETLEQIPEDASVTATTFYTTVLSERNVLYDVRYSSRQHLLETDYVVLSLTATDDYQSYGSLEALQQLLIRQGYQELDRMDGTLVIYHK